MGVRTRHESRVLLFTADEATTDAVLAAAVALGVPVDTVGGIDALLAGWGTADTVLVGGDQAAQLAGRAPRHRDRVYLVGFDADDLTSWSMPIGAEVIPLPHGLAWLSAVLADDVGSGAPVIAVIGGSGGVGASTLAAGLAFSAQRRGLSAALVDVDPLGGGVDLLLGAERTPGWRWPRLLGARGEVSDVRRFLPQVDGVSVVSMARRRPGGDNVPPDYPSAESLQAVLGSLARHHELVVLDPGRWPLPAARQPIAGASQTLLVCGTDVRQVAAADQTRLMLELDEPWLVVRNTPRNRIAPELVAETLGSVAVARLPDEPRLRRAAEAGEPPGLRGRGAWAKAVDGLLDLIGSSVNEH